MEIICKYFPKLSKQQKAQFLVLEGLYREWNAQINLISRKDIEYLYERHVLHSLGIAKVCMFKAESRVLDVGTGGGFPGIPLAILFPEVEFHLVDAIGKKIKVVTAIAQSLELSNVIAIHSRVEKIKGNFDFIVSRAVTNMPNFVKQTRKKISKNNRNSLSNGILYLKGGDLHEELKDFSKAKIYKLSDYFDEAFFDTKKVVYLPL